MRSIGYECFLDIVDRGVISGNHHHERPRYPCLLPPHARIRKPTFSLINAEGKRTLVKFHLHTQQSIKNLTDAEAVIAKDRESQQGYYHCKKADEHYGKGVAKALNIPLEKI